MHYKNHIQNKSAKAFIDQGCKGLFHFIKEMHKNHGDFIDFFERFTENTFSSLFILGLRHYKPNKILALQELGVSKSKNKWGRIDILAKDLDKKEIFVLECKSFWSSENEPKSKHWKNEKTNSFYNEIFDQAKKYINEEKFIHQYKCSLIALAFSRVEFKNQSKINDWLYMPTENEFYGFKFFEAQNRIMGLAVYGKVVYDITKTYGTYNK